MFVWVLDDRAVPGLYWMRGGGEDEGALQTLMDVVSENERDMQFFLFFCILQLLKQIS